MLDKRIILFDCMETIIDMTEIPTEKDYALWALMGSGVESFWGEPNRFIYDFKKMRRELRETFPKYKEYDLHYRLTKVVEKKMGNGNVQKRDEIVQKLALNFWKTYKEKCYISQEVARTLKKLQERYDMGIVSNFIVEGGVEEILHDLGVYERFMFVVTSVGVGWRKPHPRIYQVALKKAKVCKTQNVFFIGDDYVNDYLTPQSLGMNTIYYDRSDSYPQLNNKFCSFSELEDKIKRQEFI